jgi:hypothetical protein
MQAHRLTAHVLLAVALVAAATVPGALAAGQDTVTLDGSHGLATDEATAAFHESGNASAYVSEYQLNLTVASDHESVGLDGVYTDVDAAYLRVDYDEQITRTFRFYIPGEYWYPHVKEGHSAANADVELDMTPVRNGTMTSVMVTVTGETDAVWRVSRAAGTIYRVRDESRSLVENVTGMDLPSLSSSTPWQRLDSDQLTGSNATVPIETNGSAVTLQYDQDSNPSTSSWVNVPECDAVLGGGDPVCYSTRGSSDYIWVFSRTEGDAPPLRFRRGGGGLFSGLTSGWNDLTSIPSDLGSLFDGGWFA